MRDRLAAGRGLVITERHRFRRLVIKGVPAAPSSGRAGAPGELVPVHPGRRIGTPGEVEGHSFGPEGGSGPGDSLGAPGALAPADRTVGSQDSVGVREVGANRSSAGHGSGGAHGSRHRGGDIPIGGPFALPNETRDGDDPIF